jgi:hypothetical protein
VSDSTEEAVELFTRQYVLRSRWQDVQLRAREQNAFLKTHSWEEYAAWHLGLTEGADEENVAGAQTRHRSRCLWCESPFKGRASSTARAGDDCNGREAAVRPLEYQHDHDAESPRWRALSLCG